MGGWARYCSSERERERGEAQRRMRGSVQKSSQLTFEKVESSTFELIGKSEIGMVALGDPDPPHLPFLSGRRMNQRCCHWHPQPLIEPVKRIHFCTILPEISPFCTPKGSQWQLVPVFPVEDLARTCLVQVQAQALLAIRFALEKLLPTATAGALTLENPATRYALPNRQPADASLRR